MTAGYSRLVPAGAGLEVTGVFRVVDLQRLQRARSQVREEFGVGLYGAIPQSDGQLLRHGPLIRIDAEPRRGLRIDWDTMRRRTKEVTELLEIDLDPRTEVRDLPVAQQQLVEIARALAFEAQVVVMDEPTAALSETEIDRLLHLVRSLADRGVGVVYVSHKLDEILRLSEMIRRETYIMLELG